jgi:hypothetical protein
VVPASQCIGISDISQIYISDISQQLSKVIVIVVNVLSVPTINNNVKNNIILGNSKEFQNSKHLQCLHYRPAGSMYVV